MVTLGTGSRTDLRPPWFGLVVSRPLFFRFRFFFSVPSFGSFFRFRFLSIHSCVKESVILVHPPLEALALTKESKLTNYLHSLATTLFRLLDKYRPETKKQKQDRLKALAEKRIAAQKAEKESGKKGVKKEEKPEKRPPVVRMGESLSKVALL